MSNIERITVRCARAMKAIFVTRWRVRRHRDNSTQHKHALVQRPRSWAPSSEPPAISEGSGASPFPRPLPQRIKKPASHCAVALRIHGDAFCNRRRPCKASRGCRSTRRARLQKLTVKVKSNATSLLDCAPPNMEVKMPTGVRRDWGLINCLSSMYRQRAKS